jgi:hypothetical protein
MEGKKKIMFLYFSTEIRKREIRTGRQKEVGDKEKKEREKRSHRIREKVKERKS